MAIIESLLEDGKVTDATLGRLQGLFGVTGGEVIHEILQHVLGQVEAEPQGSEGEARAGEAGTNE